MIDLNIFIDVFQKRVPHYQDSSLVLTKILNKEITGFIAGHSVTTLYYLTSKTGDDENNQKLLQMLHGYRGTVFSKRVPLAIYSRRFKGCPKEKRI